MFSTTIVYRKISSSELLRYTVLGRVSARGYYVLHADFLRLDDRSNDDYLAVLTIERMLEFNPESVSWSPTLEAAISAHEKDFSEPL